MADSPELVTYLLAAISALATAIAVAYRGQVKALEDSGKDKQKVIDQLLRTQEMQAMIQERQADVSERVVTGLEHQGKMK